MPAAACGGGRRAPHFGPTPPSRHRLSLPSLRRYALVSILAALITIGLKGGAYFLTGSVGILSDALESLVNLLAAVIALIALTVAARPADEDHAYGHNKAEYFASGFEGALILVAAGSIAFTSVQRLLAPRPIDAPVLGLAVSGIASLVNLVVAQVLARAGRRFESITLESDARHLMTDVWTSVGVIGGVGLAAATGWNALDPIVALIVAANIVRTGIDLLRRSALGLLDTALPEPVVNQILEVLAPHREAGVQFHALRTRRAGRWRFVSFHVLVPGDWSVQRGHDLLEQIEAEIRERVSFCTIFTHLEPIEDPVSWDDQRLERERKGIRNQE